jgi:asparagine synthase (glutamine-hydrolysing)
MCGICGVYHYDKDKPVTMPVLQRMTQSLAHRGPDDEGIHIEGCIGLGHRRLAVIDLANGSQPMSSADGCTWVTYNGEIYNFKALRAELMGKGHAFVTHSDTEVILQCYEAYGTACVHKFNGMFAFAIWDRRTETLFMARDRLGIKPLYYAICKGNFIFASEIKAILKHPDIKAEIELNAIPEYLFCTALLDAHTMFKGIYSIPAGHMLVFKYKNPRITRYWDVDLNSAAGHPPRTLGQYKEQTTKLIEQSVHMQLISDVPLGCLLSGGLDSSLVTAIAAGQVNRLKTFSMEYSKNGGQEKPNSDTRHARMVAQAFETDHRAFVFKPQDYYDTIAKATWHAEKPVELTTPSLYLLYSQLKSDVSVVLSGEGADELFGGYYFFLTPIADRNLSEFPWAPYFNDVAKLLKPEIQQQTRFREKVAATLSDMLNRFDCTDHLNKVLYLFIKMYLLEMLERQDKTSMAWGIESRVPFLDHHLVEYVVNMPSAFKLRGHIEKFILKEIGSKRLPSGTLARKKKPFPFPIDPKSIIEQKNRANDLVQSGRSQIASYFDRKAAHAFFNRQHPFGALDPLAVYRTSFAFIALEMWHQAFDV